MDYIREYHSPQGGLNATLIMTKPWEEQLERCKVYLNARVVARSVWELECLDHNITSGFDPVKYRTTFSYIKGWTWIDKDWVRPI